VKTYIYATVILSLIGFASFGVLAIQNYGNEQYQAGYDARSKEQADAKEAADAQTRQLEEQQRKRINELQASLKKSRERSEQLAAQIRVTEFDCPALGDDFLRLFNLGAQGHTPAD